MIWRVRSETVIRKELYRRHRWVAQSFFKALLEAKTVCIESAFKNDSLHSFLPWAGNHMEEIRELMGEDFCLTALSAIARRLRLFFAIPANKASAGGNYKPKISLSRKLSIPSGCKRAGSQPPA